MALNNEPEKQRPNFDNKGRFLPGNTVGHGGRPKGSRNLLGQALVDDLYQDYLMHGPSVIKQVRETEPATYLKIVCNLLPQKVEADIQHSHVVYLPEHLSADQIESKYGNNLIEHEGNRDD
jgi:hypothetical protein